MYKNVITLACVSRLILFFIQIIGNHLLPDHKADAFLATRTPVNNSWCNKMIDFGFTGFRHWDGEYFMHIAEHGYTYENVLAFYPIYPYIIRTTVDILVFIIPTNFDCALPRLLLLIGALWNVVFFCAAAIVLYKLTIIIFGDRNKARLAVLLFCFNPASIFFSAIYTESLFALLTFTTIWFCVQEKFIYACLPLALGMWCRANGLINYGFPLYYIFKRVYIQQNMLEFVKLSFKTLVITILIVCVCLAREFTIHKIFCMDNGIDFMQEIRQQAESENYILAGTHTLNKNTSPWCDEPFAFSYSYVQSKYWDVGFLRYYQWRQALNFILAFPILYVFISYSMKYGKRNFNVIFRLGFLRLKGFTEMALDARLYVFVAHGLFLTIFCILFVHIQVSTRLLCSASPLLYWIGAEYLTDCLRGRNGDNTKVRNMHLKDIFKLNLQNQWITQWFGAYYVIGTVCFANFYPWT